MVTTSASYSLICLIIHYLYLPIHYYTFTYTLEPDSNLAPCALLIVPLSNEETEAPRGEVMRQKWSDFLCLGPRLTVLSAWNALPFDLSHGLRGN